MSSRNQLLDNIQLQMDMKKLQDDILNFKNIIFESSQYFQKLLSLNENCLPQLVPPVCAQE